MSTFVLQQLTQGQTENRYERLGYVTNPFPQQGRVSLAMEGRPAAVFVPRSELTPVQTDFAEFLQGTRRGKVWAVLGEHGVGKSNFLRVVQQELVRGDAEGTITGTAWALFAGSHMTPAHLVEGMVSAIGERRIESLLGAQPQVPERFKASDFGRFWSQRTSWGNGESAAFLVRWLAGSRTSKAERQVYGIEAEQRLPPAIAVPYLRALVDMLARADFLHRMVLLIDEFEDVQALSRTKQTEYAQMLKTILNAFDWSGLYVLLAGAPNAFEVIGERFPSLATRWTPVRLRPVETAAQALELARAYKESGRRDADQDVATLEPLDVDVKTIFVELAQKQNPPTQRELLTRLHEEVERLANEAAGREPQRRSTRKKR
jgi:hypothetical protein